MYFILLERDAGIERRSRVPYKVHEGLAVGAGLELDVRDVVAYELLVVVDFTVHCQRDRAIVADLHGDEMSKSQKRKESISGRKKRKVARENPSKFFGANKDSLRGREMNTMGCPPE